MLAEEKKELEETPDKSEDWSWPEKEVKAQSDTEEKRGNYSGAKVSDIWTEE